MGGFDSRPPPPLHGCNYRSVVTLGNVSADVAASAESNLSSPDEFPLAAGTKADDARGKRRRVRTDDIEILPPIYVGVMTAEQREGVVRALARIVCAGLEREAEAWRAERRHIAEILNSGYTVGMETKIIQMRGRGTLTLPSPIRDRYALSEGDPMTLVDLDGVMVLSPKIGVVAKLAVEIERLREETGLSVEDLIEGQAQQRKRLPPKS